MNILSYKENLKLFFKGLWYGFWIPIYKVTLGKHILFDLSYYEEFYGKSVKGPSLAEDYFEHGCYGSKNPHPLFDAYYYLIQKPWLKALRINPLWHYVLWGRFSRVNPHPLFETNLYAPFMSWLDRIRFSPLEHFLLTPENWDLKLSSEIDWKQYINFLPVREKENSLLRFAREHYFDLRISMQESLKRKAEIAYHENRHADCDRFLQQVTFLQGKFIKKLVVLPIQSLHALCKKNLYLLKEWEPEKRVISPLAVLPEPHHERFTGGGITFPSVYLAKIPEVTVIGGSRYLIKDQTLFSDELKYSLENHFDPKCETVFPLSTQLVFSAEVKPRQEFSNGILISCEHDTNFFHWVVECLPKIIIANETIEDKTIPFFIIKNLHPNLLELLKAVNREQRPVIELRKGVNYLFKNLYYPSDTSRLVDRYEGSVHLDDCKISSAWVQRVAESVLNFYGAGNVEPFRKLYFSRKITAARKALGETELISELEKQGFEILKLDELSVKDQITKISEAKVIVGPSGASFTNLLFAPKGSLAIILNSVHPNANLYVYGQIAQSREVNLKFLLGPRAYALRGKFSVHDDFYVDRDKVLSLL